MGGFDFGRAIRFIAASFLVFVAGIFSGLQEWLPARIAREAQVSLGLMKSNAMAALTQTPNQHVGTRHFSGDGVTRAAPDRMSPGVTLVSGLFGQKLGFRLFGADGQLLYEWPINFFTVAPEVMEHRYHALIHGEALFPNGDIVANLDGRGMIRFDRCGKVLWRNDGRTHHSIFVDDAGLLWAPTAGPYYKDTSLMAPPFRLDQIGVFDPETGKQLRSIDLVDVIRNSDLRGLIQESGDRLDDVGHLNDVEVLGAGMAAAFPMFAAGDILLSWRNLNEIWVIDGKDNHIKWVSNGPTLGQHDPDFRSDGTITVLDNRPQGSIRRDDGYPGRGGGSRIVAIRPGAETHDVLFSSTKEHPFYTPYRGKQQFLPNGNLLVAETDAGRAFEVTPAGDIVWEYVNGWDETRVGWVTGVERYPVSYGDFATQSCPTEN